jgi:hypothetical protein
MVKYNHNSVSYQTKILIIFSIYCLICPFFRSNETEQKLIAHSAQCDDVKCMRSNKILIDHYGDYFKTNSFFDPINLIVFINQQVILIQNYLMILPFICCLLFQNYQNSLKDLIRSVVMMFCWNIFYIIVVMFLMRDTFSINCSGHVAVMINIVPFVSLVLEHNKIIQKIIIICLIINLTITCIFFHQMNEIFCGIVVGIIYNILVNFSAEFLIKLFGQ